MHVTQAGVDGIGKSKEAIYLLVLTGVGRVVVFSAGGHRLWTGRTAERVAVFSALMAGVALIAGAALTVVAAFGLQGSSLTETLGLQGSSLTEIMEGTSRVSSSIQQSMLSIVIAGGASIPSISPPVETRVKVATKSSEGFMVANILALVEKSKIVSCLRSAARKNCENGRANAIRHNSLVKLFQRCDRRGNACCPETRQLTGQTEWLLLLHRRA